MSIIFFEDRAICEIIVSYVNLSLCDGILKNYHPALASDIFHRVRENRVYANYEDLNFLSMRIPLSRRLTLARLLQMYLPKLEIFNFRGVKSSKITLELASDPKGAYLLFRSRAFLGCLQLKDIGQVIIALSHNSAFKPGEHTEGITRRDQLIKALFDAAFKRLSDGKHRELINYCKGAGITFDPDPELGNTLAVPKKLTRAISSH